ncbi:MAG: glycogen/starch/alpha-glucan phosphorylase, partial [Burkholderiales bacterium]|nr:glycogen/starch/alpha-glucan phosphorylase [Burkholderiales bacterium]
EQVAAAGLEPWGSMHIKFAMNGAVTVGALNGTVVELGDRVGEENIYLFGRGAEETSALRENGVHPREFYSRSPEIRRALDIFLTDELSPGEPGRFAWVYHFLVENWDRFHHLADLESYFEAHARAERNFADRDAWARKAIANAAGGAAMSSYAAVLEYASEIWDIPARVRAGGRA